MSLKSPTPAEISGDIEPETIKISEDLQLTVKGLPPDLSTEYRSRVLAGLVSNALSRLPERAYEKGETIYAGRAKLIVLNKLHEVEFSIDAIRVMTALAIYKQAFDKINTGAATGLYDKELAELTADYVKGAAWDEVQSFERKRARDVKPNEFADRTAAVSEERGLPAPKEDSDE